MLNNVSIQGRLTRDIEVKQTNSGKSVASFSLAVERNFGNPRKTDFFDIVAWDASADFVSRYFHKGDMMLVTGRLEVRLWQDKNGNNRTTTEIIAEQINFCGGKSSNSPSSDTADVETEDDCPF